MYQQGGKKRRRKPEPPPPDWMEKPIPKPFDDQPSPPDPRKK